MAFFKLPGLSTIKALTGVSISSDNPTLKGDAELTFEDPALSELRIRSDAFRSDQNFQCSFITVKTSFLQLKLYLDLCPDEAS